MNDRFTRHIFTAASTKHKEAWSKSTLSVATRSSDEHLGMLLPVCTQVHRHRSRLEMIRIATMKTRALPLHGHLKFVQTRSLSFSNLDAFFSSWGLSGVGFIETTPNLSATSLRFISISWPSESSPWPRMHSTPKRSNLNQNAKARSRHSQPFAGQNRFHLFRSQVLNPGEQISQACTQDNLLRWKPEASRFLFP